jgi:hypothetical protein
MIRPRRHARRRDAACSEAVACDFGNAHADELPGRFARLVRRVRSGEERFADGAGSGLGIVEVGPDDRLRPQFAGRLRPVAHNLEGGGARRFDTGAAVDLRIDPRLVERGDAGDAADFGVHRGAIRDAGLGGRRRGRHRSGGGPFHGGRLVVFRRGGLRFDGHELTPNAGSRVGGDWDQADFDDRPACRREVSRAIALRFLRLVNDVAGRDAERLSSVQIDRNAIRNRVCSREPHRRESFPADNADVAGAPDLRGQAPASMAVEDRKGRRAGFHSGNRQHFEIGPARVAAGNRRFGRKDNLERAVLRVP